MTKNKIALLAFFLLAFGSAAHADKFQFYYLSDGDSLYVSYSVVKVFDGTKEVFKGYTDKYGRITIQLDNGTYEVIAEYRKMQLKSSLVIRGSRTVKKLFLKEQ